MEETGISSPLLMISQNIYLLKNKSDAFEKFKEFLREVENQFGRKVKRFSSDRGREYESSKLNSFVEFLACPLVS